MHDSSNNYIRGSHNKVVLSLQSLPLRADTCAMEWKLGMARKTMQNDRILSFLPLICVRNNLQHADHHTSFKS